MLQFVLPKDSNRQVSAHRAFTLYLALKHHVSGRYDVVKYNWKVKASPEAFAKRKDKYFFSRLAEKYTMGELVHLYLCNFISNEEAWVGDISGADALSHYREHMSKVKCINEVYVDDVKNIYYMHKKLNVSIGRLFEYDEANVSVIFKMVQSQVISHESFILLDSFLDIINKHNTLSKNNCFIWNEYSVKLSGYKNILKLNSILAKKVFVDTIKQMKEI